MFWWIKVTDGGHPESGWAERVVPALISFSALLNPRHHQLPSDTCALLQITQHSLEEKIKACLEDFTSHSLHSFILSLSTIYLCWVHFVGSRPWARVICQDMPSGWSSLEEGRRKDRRRRRRGGALWSWSCLPAGFSQRSSYQRERRRTRRGRSLLRSMPLEIGSLNRTMVGGGEGGWAWGEEQGIAKV